MTFKGIKAGDYDYDLVVTCKNARTKAVEPIDSYSTFKFDLYDPDGNMATEDAVFYTDGTDGKLKYTVTDGDIDEAGEWTLIVRVDNLTSDPITFTVT